MPVRAHILLVEDDPGVAKALAGLLGDEGHRTTHVSDTRRAWDAIFAVDAPDLVILDVRLPGESGLELLARLPKPLPTPVIVLSGEASAGEAVQSLRLGALDFVEKPPTEERLLTAVRNALSLVRLHGVQQQLEAALAQPGHLIGESRAIADLRKAVARIGPTEAVVMIQGETGTGKERAARALHLASGRTGRFVAVNCSAIPANLLESELFGHERGAFSGATSRHVGRFEQAHGGTLLLDEIGDMPLELQSKLLRVLEEREIERVGGTGPIPIDVRILAATHRDIGRLVGEGRFREDLYYRLNVVPLKMPPLRDRPDDILPLAQAFAQDLVGPDASFTVAPEAVAALQAYRWPGNVRELRNLVERLTLLGTRGEPVVVDLRRLEEVGPVVPAEAGSPRISGSIGDRSYRELVEDFERSVLKQALDAEKGNVAGAARRLKMDRGNLHRRLKALGVPVDSESGK